MPVLSLCLAGLARQRRCLLPARLPASNPEHGSAATTATGAQPAPLLRAASNQEGAQREQKEWGTSCPVPPESPGPRPPVPRIRASSSAYGALPEIPRRHGPPRRTALQWHDLTQLSVTHTRTPIYIMHRYVCARMNTPPYAQAAAAGKLHLPADGAARSRPATAKAGGELTQQEREPEGSRHRSRLSAPGSPPAGAAESCGQGIPLRLLGAGESPAVLGLAVVSPACSGTPPALRNVSLQLGWGCQGGWSLLKVR